MSPFGDVLAANDAYAQAFRLAGLSGSAARGLAVLTCIDSVLTQGRSSVIEEAPTKARIIA